MWLIVALSLGLWPAAAEVGQETASDPEWVIPACPTPPKIDGQLAPGEWQFAVALTGLEAYNAGSGMRTEQPVFYVFRDRENLYVAMDSLESNTNTLVASCVKHDYLGLIGDDCLELMVAPGTRSEADRFDFPTFYLAANSLGTIWDARFVPLSAEVHNSWESGVEVANAVDGTRNNIINVKEYSMCNF
jgi:hypothetical protein